MTILPHKIDFDASREALDEQVPTEGPFFLYDLHFFKGSLLVAEMQAAFDHVISREELVNFLKGYDEVRNERYGCKCVDVRSISYDELVKIRQELVISRGAFQMTHKAIDAQDEDKMMAGAIDNLLAVDKKTKAKAHKAPELKKILKKKGFL